jgi:hypothetical protein
MTEVITSIDEFEQHQDARIMAVVEEAAKKPANSLPEDQAMRNNMAMADGLLDYFPNALAAVACHSKLAGDKHHPGEPLHWERGKSMDHRNKIMRHLVDSGGVDQDGNLHSAGLAWRALALLQEELEQLYGYPPPRNAR